VGKLSGIIYTEGAFPYINTIRLRGASPLLFLEAQVFSVLQEKTV